MSADRRALDTPAAALRHTLTCGACGAHLECTLTALFRYTQRGWPRCCGEVMALTADEAGTAELPKLAPQGVAVD